jgi:hypothetical protein
MPEHRQIRFQELTVDEDAVIVYCKGDGSLLLKNLLQAVERVSQGITDKGMIVRIED